MKTLASPKVSIIVPNYNHAAFLSQRLDSIFNQTYKDFEVILLDDASTDHSVQILEEYAVKYKDKVTHLVVNQINSGSPFKQWRKGIELAKGAYIWIAESDDYCETTFLEKLMAATLAYPNTTIGVCNLIKINEESSLLTSRTNFIDQYYLGKSIIVKEFTKGNYLWNASAVIFKKEASRVVDWMQVEQMKFCGDWLFWVMLLQAGNLLTISDYLSYFRVHIKSVSSSSSAQIKYFSEGLEVIRWILDNCSLHLDERRSVCNRWLKQLQKSNLDKLRKREFEAAIKKLFPLSYPLTITENNVKKLLRRFRRRLLLQ